MDFITIIKSFDNKKYLEVKKILSAMYLSGFGIPNSIPIIEHPWWSPCKHEDYLNQDVISYFNSQAWPQKINVHDFSKILEMYNLLNNKEVFHERCFPLASSLMELAFSNKSDINRIFDVHILLEFLFGPGFQGEISFRIAMNASLFISKDLKEFEKNFHFFKNLYSIRSNAIHGADWQKHANKSLKKLNKKGWQFSNINEIFWKIEDYVKLIIQRLLERDITVIEFQKKINDDPLFFLKNSKLLIDYDEINC